MEKYHGETLDYWKTNAEKDYVKTPISVLKYIAVLEEAQQQVKSVDLADVIERSEQYFCCKDQINQRCSEQCLGCFQFQNKD